VELGVEVGPKTVKGEEEKSVEGWGQRPSFDLDADSDSVLEPSLLQAAL